MKYIAYYNSQEFNYDERYSAVSAVNKIDYIVDKLKETGEKVEIISASRTMGQFASNARSFNIDKDLNIHYLFSLPNWKPPFDRIANAFQKTELFIYLLFVLKKGEKVLAYHDISLCRLLVLLKKLKKIRLILEVEEVFSDVRNYGMNVRKAEYQLFRIADSYILSTQSLAKEIGCGYKHYIVLNGTYRANNSAIVQKSKSTIDVVYSGTFKSAKGVLQVIAAGRYLPDIYRIHILGFGSDDEIRAVKQAIENENAYKGAVLEYVGLLKGEEFNEYLCRCDIGVSPQDPDASFNLTSFPSKLMTYLGCGLTVVSIDIPSIKNSYIGDLLVYFHDQNPKEIAKSIRCVRELGLSKEAHLERIRELDSRFASEIKELLKE